MPPAPLLVSVESPTLTASSTRDYHKSEYSYHFGFWIALTNHLPLLLTLYSLLPAPLSQLFPNIYPLDSNLLKMTAGIRGTSGANFFIEFAFGIADIFGCSDDDLG